MKIITGYEDNVEEKIKAIDSQAQNVIDYLISSNKELSAEKIDRLCKSDITLKTLTKIKLNIYKVSIPKSVIVELPPEKIIQPETTMSSRCHCGAVKEYFYDDECLVCSGIPF